MLMHLLLQTTYRHRELHPNCIKIYYLPTELIYFHNNKDKLKHKFFIFLNSLVDLILEAILVATFILATYLISLLIKYTIGQNGLI